VADLGDCVGVSRDQVLTDEQWAAIEPLFPSSEGRQSRPFRDHRQVFEGIVYRYRVGCPWRDLPAGFGPWQTVWKRHARFSRDGTWDAILTRLHCLADDAGEIDWAVAVDSTISRVHQHGANMSRETAATSPSFTGGSAELHDSAA
jgi:transposase